MADTCRLDGCDKPARYRGGLCRMHAARWERHGDFELHHHRRNILDRFWSKVAKGADDECWEYMGVRVGMGYGQLRLDGADVRISSHRLSYLIHYGPFDRRLWVLHHCDNPPCVNPAHLYLGTNVENVRDRTERKRQVRDVCRKGHPLTPDNVIPNGKGRTCKTCRQASSRANTLRRKERANV